MTLTSTGGTATVQNMQRMARASILERHSGHSLSSGCTVRMNFRCQAYILLPASDCMGGP